MMLFKKTMRTKLKQNQKVSQDLEPHEHLWTDKQTMHTSTLSDNYVDAKLFTESLIDSGFDNIDIMVALNERFDRELVDVILEEYRAKGIL
jgi:hypothetical protein